MVYQDFLREIRSLEFIRDEEMADSAIKAVLGIMLSSMREEDARKLAQTLPNPLTIDRLRGHQKRHLRVTPDYYINEIGLQFSLAHDRAAELVSTVLNYVKKNIPEEIVVDWESHLPAEVAEVVRSA